MMTTIVHVVGIFALDACGRSLHLFFLEWLRYEGQRTTPHPEQKREDKKGSLSCCLC